MRLGLGLGLDNGRGSKGNAGTLPNPGGNIVAAWNFGDLIGESEPGPPVEIINYIKDEVSNAPLFMDSDSGQNLPAGVSENDVIVSTIGSVSPGFKILGNPSNHFWANASIPNGTLAGTAPFTLHMLVAPVLPSNSTCWILTAGSLVLKATDNGSGTRKILATGGFGTLTFVDNTSTGPLDSNDWVQLIWSYDGANHRTYFFNVTQPGFEPVNLGPIAGAFNNGGAAFQLGKNGSNYSNFTIDSLAFWNRGITNTEALLLQAQDEPSVKQYPY